MTIPQLYTIYQQSSGVCTDTRSIKKGNLFFALKGDNFDGNRFAQKAIDAGASYAVIDNPDYKGYKTILVDDVLKSLQQLSTYHREQLSIPIIGLTGSNGKTTTKELITAVLRTTYHTAATLGNLNNHIGVPLSLLAIQPEHEMAVIEMGANHQKEIEFLCTLCQPDYGYITNFGKAHLEGFGGVQGVIKGKTELYTYLRENKKKVFINSHDTIQLEKSKGIDRITFGHATGVDVLIKPVNPDSSLVEVHYKGLKIQSQLTGAYNLSNVGAAIAVGKYFDILPEKIKEGIENYFPSNNRSQLTKTEHNTLIVDTYNANPSSMEAALKNLEAYEANEANEKWVILGDMFELGEYSGEEHQKIANIAQKASFEKVILIGEAFSKCRAPGSLQFKNTPELLAWLENNEVSGKTILLKGSRGMAIERALPHL